MTAMPAEATPYVPTARDESRRVLEQVLDVLGHPLEWAVQLEQRCYEAGRVWQPRDDLLLTMRD
jgi:uncharacterized protein (DUF2461 family)